LALSAAKGMMKKAEEQSKRKQQTGILINERTHFYLKGIINE
jgi:hypothetical protein